MVCYWPTVAKPHIERSSEMSAFSDSYVSRVLPAIRASRSSFDAEARRWLWLRTSLLDPYRPERHYMRGPGPKCRDKLARCAQY